MNKTFQYNYYKLLFICCLSLIVLPLFGQEEVKYVADVQHFTVEDGLAHRMVYDVYQDSRGFIWMGTRLGLNRFDGHEWLTFSKEKHGLTDNAIWQIEEDEEGWLWLITTIRGGIKTISFIHTVTLEVKSFEERFSTPPFQIEDLYSIFGGDDGSLHFSQKNEILTYQNAKWSSQAVKASDNFLLSAKTPKGNWIVQSNKKQQSSFNMIRDNGTFQKIFDLRSDVTAKDCYLDREEKIWIAERGKIYYSPTEPIDFKVFPFDDKLNETPQNDNYYDFLTRIHGQVQNGQDIFWCKTATSFFIFTENKRVIYNFKKDYPEIIKKYILKIVFDKQGNAWITTDFGVYKIRLTPSRFTNHLALPVSKYETNDAKSLRGMHLDGDQLWVNTVGREAFLIDINTHTTRQIPIQATALDQLKALRPILHLGNKEYLTFNHELVRYKDYEPIASYFWKKDIAPNFAWSLHQDVQKNIWIGTHDKGLATLENDSIAYYNRYNDFKDLETSSVYHFLKWDDKHILLSSTSGIYVLNIEKGIIQRFSTNAPKAQQIPFDVIHHIHRDSENPNIIWVATGGGGLLQLTLDSETWSIQEQQQITTFDGLSNNVIYSVYEDDYQNLWMSSDVGINRYHKTSQQTKIYTTKDGLPFNEFNRISHHQSADGRLFFGSMNGLATFHPSELLTPNQDKAPAFEITSIEQFIGRKNQLESRTNDFYDTKKIILAPNDKFINIKFALLEFQDASQVQYSYQLSGQGEEWFYLNDNQLRLSGLPYGNMTLKIRAQGLSNPIEAAIIDIPIRVLRPFYLRWWFILFMIGIVTTIVLYLFKSRTEQLEKRQSELENLVKQRTEKIEEDKAVIEQQAEELRNLDEMKSKFFANVSHELRTPLTLMLAPIENTLRENQLTNKAYTNLLLAQKNGQRLNRMINEILDLTKLEAGKLQVEQQKTVLYTFLKNITASFESVANQGEVDFIFKYQEDKYLQLLLDQKKVEIILLNLLSNAFKFTPKQGTVRLSVINEGEFINFTVSDTGRGIHPEDLPNIFNRFYQSKKKDAADGGTGIGLALSKEFTTLLGGTITVESQLNEGATFTVRLPKQELISKVNEKDAVLIQNEALHTSNRLEAYKQTTTIPAPSASATTILLVEDNHDLRYFIQSLLSEKYKVIAAENGKVGLEKLATLPCELIISDVMMPIMDGYELLEKVKTDERYHQIPMIMLTARSAFDDKMKALRIGVDDYLTKPFQEEELFVRIENLLQNAENRKAAIEMTTEAAEEILTVELATHIKTSNSPKTITSEMQTWLAEVEAKLLEKIEDNHYTVDQLAADMTISKRQLARRIKELVGLTPNQYIKTIRYTKARELLENKTYPTVKAVALSVGFKDVAHFSRQYKEQFGKLPSEYF